MPASLPPESVVAVIYALTASTLLAFIAIRLVYERGWKLSQRTAVHNRREHALTVIFGSAQILSLAYWLTGDSLSWAELSALGVYLPPSLRLLAGLVCVLSVGLFWWIHATLGTNFSPRLDMRANHRLVTTGPYRWVRHPMYTTNVLLVPGWGLLTANLVVLVLPALALALMLALRLPDEERMMAERFGPAWQAWARRTGRLLPRLGSAQDS